MSKNTQISELINYISVDGSGNVVFTTVSAAASNTDKFLVSDAGTLKYRTAAQLLSDIGAQASGSYQAALSGTGFVKISGTTISYDNSTYATQTYVTTAISNLVASAPSTLDTLNELATALGNDANFATTVATSIGTKQPQLNGTGFVKVTGTTVSYDNATYLTTGTAGTTYVPYTGATGNVNLGVYNLAGGNVNINGGGSGGGALRLKQFGSSEANLEGYNSISTLTSGVFYFTSSASVPNFKNFVLNPSGLTDNTLRTYTLPDASGTLALTSDIPSVSGVYLPLAGGTLTGALNAPSASFSGAASVINTFNLYKTGGTTLGGQLAYDSAVNQLYLWNNVSSGYFSIYTNSVERLKILSGGNVGINTPTPLELFSVTGNVHIAGVGNSLLFDTDAIGRSITQYVTNLYEFHILNARGNSSRFVLGNGSISLGTSTTPQFYINTTSGNVGIGTSSPTSLLHVKGDNAKIRVSGPTYTSVEIEDGGTGDPGYIRTYTYGTANCQIGDGGTYFNTGNIGMGTSSPLKNLHVYASNGSGIGIGRNLTTDNFSANLFFYPSSLSADKRNWAITTYFAGPGLMEFRRSVTSTSDPYDNGVTVMSLDSITDFVGIGTTSPAQKLHVKTSTNYQGILINGSNAPAIGFAKGDGTTPEWKLGISGNDGTAISISSGAANTDKIIIGSNGNVGIGGLYNSKLNVGGAIQANRSIYNWYQGSYVGNSTYLHIKTNMWAGGSPSGNSEYTMSLFKGYMYAYGTPPALEGTIVFHNWDGNFYNIGTTGNLFVTAYKSTDGYVVLVTNSGSGEAGITIDWHQAYGYPFRDRTVSTSKLYGATTGGY
jgi:hypothetical protein